MALLICLMIAFVLRTVHGQECAIREFGEGYIVCVCNATYCDSIEIEVPPKGTYRSYTSTRSGERFAVTDGSFGEPMNLEINLELNANMTYQMIHGFGGAFTDSAGLNIRTLSNATQEQLIKAYFTSAGSHYNIGRVPVGGTDFSTRPYTLDDVVGDVRLSNFSLAPEDEMYKIPYMKRALELNPELRFLGGCWTAPPWMKSNHNFTGMYGYLEPQYYQVYAEYLVKFLEAYEDNNLPIWAITTGNEPSDGYVPLYLNDMAWTPSSITIWVINNLAPTIRRSTSHDTIILVHDDQRFDLPWAIDDMYATNRTIADYIAGIAVHWYWEGVIPPSVLDITHDRYPDKFLLMTEACTGDEPWQTRVVSLGDWGRAERYIHSIIEDTKNWMTGWIDWNLALNIEGGPNWVDNNVDSSVITIPESDEFYKQPMYYAVAHFSKFVARGSRRIELTTDVRLGSVAFLTPDDNIVIVLHNPTDWDQSISINDPEEGAINMSLAAHAMRTVIYKR